MSKLYLFCNYLYDYRIPCDFTVCTKSALACGNVVDECNVDEMVMLTMI